MHEKDLKKLANRLGDERVARSLAKFQCRYCRQAKADHADNGKCLYEPTFFESLTEEQIQAQIAERQTVMKELSSFIHKWQGKESLTRQLFPARPVLPKGPRYK
jgi:hypothetical protein